MPVKIHRTESAAGELGVVELQGKLHFDEVDGTKATVGTFCRVNELQGKATIQTGRYLIHGDHKKLDRPLAILQKRPRGKKYTYCVVGVIHQKVVFKSRPCPIVD
mmetsp:Transcript_2448/g.3852  ORF Transcript_2448/g.3852 Transcript_2448/m.3852 type:complete len:105 (+) Transcript_2448:95-409(+)|eukprot:CAMPEP_0198701942 /NCGR_PEP_ID=MMETSP1468-20131203/388465_1 /TAXON_ID=1461545 /ORGANISM="Mantoniella sp, Strain CCMP1436" /LENGTH=104 /DNA_ID=CAMNT_0044460399 /DNA_START=455 /DNA_END=769 /DNA_ORIENTATION=-